ncbi:BadF/BadG/BcrA/BcrD ATPase family protein [Paenibacillus donghaensis]|uniref:ATPase n=1 Tax=Paenibacillus donghaensis TaxID=414771 RepID=A0A2Z2KDB5_9BACL|nr:BadF/BadG/BcrA/BcrD ATPase family protein [Paenibacillus donghaensis]ASA24706.1 ATPase [Paenibacillus donghaensis]
MLNTKQLVIGIDGGGTRTRVMVSDRQGHVLAYVEKGGASIHRDPLARDNVHEAIREALAAAGRTAAEVSGIAAGIAGYDKEEDLQWVESLTAVEGLDCPRWHFNDAVAAHYGALLTEPGIVVLSGTGSVIVAITEAGESIRNYDFHHYTGSGSRFISYNAVYEVLAGNTAPADSLLVQQLLEHWQVATVMELAVLGKAGFMPGAKERDRRFEQFTPCITAAAVAGSPLAQRVCDRCIQQMKIGIEMLALLFSSETVPVAFIGSVINSPYFKDNLTALLACGNHKTYTLPAPVFSPVTGSVLYAISQLSDGIRPAPAVMDNLRRSIHTRP